MILSNVILPEDISQDQLLNEIDKLNKDKILMEYYYNARLQKHLNKEEAFEKLTRIKDIDCSNPYNIGLLDIGKIIEILQHAHQL